MSPLATPQGSPLPPVIFFGGKGGVGKTTLAAATALVAGERGERCLLVSTDPAHSLSDLLETPFSDEAREYRPGVFVRELDPASARDRYLQQVKANIRDFTAPEFIQEAERQIDLAGTHPGAVESALFESLCQVVDERGRWDRIIVDTAPTGHSLHLLGLPEAMSAWTESLLQRQSGRPAAQGPEGEARWQRLSEVLDRRRGLFERMRHCLQSAAEAAFILVMNQDRLSIRESERAAEQLRELGVSIPLLVINRVNGETDAVDLPPALRDIPRRDLAREPVTPSGSDAVLALGRRLWVPRECPPS